MITVTSRTRITPAAATITTTATTTATSAAAVPTASHPALASVPVPVRRHRLAELAAEVASTVLSWVLPARCAGCDRDGVELCSRCRCAMLGATGVGDVSVATALSGPRGTLVAMSFSGAARRVIVGLKYRNRRILARYLAGLMVNRIVAAGLRPGIDIDVVTWAPTSAQRRRQRGYDHAELIARQVAAQLGLPARRLLQRHHGAPAQTGAGRAERLRGPSFAVSPRADGARVLVIDDVVTTGATLDAARAALKASGARRVIIGAVAATPSAINDHHGLVATSDATGRSRRCERESSVPLARIA